MWVWWEVSCGERCHVQSPCCSSPPPATQNGLTALISASYFGHVESVKALLAAGANKEAKDNVGGYGGEGRGEWSHTTSMSRTKFICKFTLHISTLTS